MIKLIYVMLCFYTITAANLESGLKMGHCRAHCIRKFMGAEQKGRNCSENMKCSFCWSTCEKLSVNYPIWRFNCGRKARCETGCQYACDFMSDEIDVVPLSSYNSRLTLMFHGMTAKWSISLGPNVPDQKIVFALFTKESGRSWKLRLQTEDTSTSLDDLKAGTELKLIAIAESGLLSVIITPFDPQLHKGVRVFEDDRWTKENIINDSKNPEWLLNYEASLKKSGLIAAKIWWESDGLNKDYFVTWEVAGGGLKGNLYTDIPEVDLTLWPETVYNVQVEIPSSSLTERVASEPLTLNTHNITLVGSRTNRSPSQPLVHAFEDASLMEKESIIGITVGLLGIVIIIVVIVYVRYSRLHSQSKLNLNQTSSDFDDSSFDKTKRFESLEPKYISNPVPVKKTDAVITICPVRPGNLYVNHPAISSPLPPHNFHSHCIHNSPLPKPQTKLSIILKKCI